MNPSKSNNRKKKLIKKRRGVERDREKERETE
jgi:hypothetical protein